MAAISMLLFQLKEALMQHSLFDEFCIGIDLEL
jgi:hypothetical protein